MPGQNCDVFDILRLELAFLELGPYRAPTPGRPLLIFQDSPNCPLYGSRYLSELRTHAVCAL